ncbi:MAG: YqhV family protein [Thermoflavifilum sp.]|nr:YqhV family protein [Thermoflavifilum sp.]MCL6514001.1 YqhV family protein [Alicyclobacillus sp.]
MFHVADRIVYAMAGLRMMSSALELCGALLMLYFGTAERALQVNAMLAFVGPTVLVLVTALGVTALAGEVQWHRLLWIALGVCCILYGATGD